jgi:hypothetical protein
MTTPTCATCRWWHRYEVGADDAECRRFPPVIPRFHDDGFPIQAAFPVTWTNDYCGEHTPKGEG